MLPGGSYANANDINALGQVVGEASVSNGARAFLWLPSPAYGLPAGMNNLGVLPGGSLSLANGINAQGQVVGVSYNYQGYNHAILWLPSAAYGRSAGMNDLGTLPGGTNSAASAINAQGQVVGKSYNYQGYQHAILWLPSAAYGRSAGMNDLGTLPGAAPAAASYAVGINSQGQVIGSSQTATGAYHGFLWLPAPAYGLPAGMNDLGVVAGDTYSYANGINDKGQVVVSGTTNGFLWQNGVQVPITGKPSAINASGQIVSGTTLLTPTGGPQPDHGGNAINSLVSVTIACPASSAVTQAALLAPGPFHAPGTNSNDIIAQFPIAKPDAYSVRVVFNLTQAVPGPRSVVLSLSNGTSLTLPLPFTIDNAGYPQIAVSLIGGNTALIGGVQKQYLRPGRTGTYQLILTNTGNVDAMGVPVWIVFPNLPAGSTFDYSGFGLQAPPALTGMTVNWSAYSAFPRAGTQYMLPIFIARLPAGAAQSLQIKITPGTTAPANTPLPIQVWSNPFYHNFAGNGAAQAQINLKNLAKAAYAYANTGQTPNDSAFDMAAGRVMGQMGSIVGAAYSGAAPMGSLTSFAQLLDEILLLTPQGQALSSANLQAAVATGLFSSPMFADFTQESFQSVSPLLVTSIDPNGLSGPLGFTSGNVTFVRGDAPMTFTIGFANKPGAFPAQTVGISQALDSSAVDLTRLNIQAVTVEGTAGDPNFPSYTLTSIPVTQTSSPIGSHTFLTNTSVMQAGGAPVTATVSAAVNLDTGALTCSLSTTNPAGFLAGGADGTVSFSVPWKAGAPAGATLQTQAVITFDANAPLSAPSTPLIYALDNAAPTSQILPLPALTAPQFSVQWGGADNDSGCGVKDYTIFVSDNGGAYNVWQSNTTATQAMYNGAAGHTYAFIIQSRDNLNNVETLRTVADATTTTARTVTGRIALEGVSNLAAVSPAAPLGAFHIAFRKPGTTTELYGCDVALTPVGTGAFGTYTLYNVPAGMYDAAVKGAKNLRVLVSGVSVATTSTVPNVILPAGDSNGDNSVDSSDFGVLIGAFNTDGSIAGSGYDPTADFNYDGSVDSSDFALLIGQFNNAGAL